jgi:hypothetical protein
MEGGQIFMKCTFIFHPDIRCDRFRQCCFNFDLIEQLSLWNRRSNAGKAFDSFTGFELPAGGDRSPDVTGISSDN